jgi:signal transduction histidine kinase
MKGYDAYYISQSLRPFRSGLILAIGLYSFFGVLDFYAAPISYQKIWVIRLLIVSILFAAWYLSFSKKFFKYFILITSISALTVSYGILGILYLLQADELAILEYHNGLVLCLFGASTIFRLRPFHASIISSIVVVSYVWLAYFNLGLFGTANPAKLLNNVFFIASSAIMGMVYMSSLEKVLKKNYLNDQLIREEKDRLAKVKIDLEVSDSIKNKLLAIISHDIRGPLSTIKGLLLLCQFKRITQNEFDVHLKKLIGAVDNTSLLLENLLCWSTHDSQNKSVGNKVDVRNVVNDIFSLFEEPARIKNNNLINSVNPQTIILSDQSVIKLIVRNFIANAIKFTENGLITVRTDAISEHQVRISVNDTGNGMSQEVTAKLFNWGLKQSSEGTKGEKGAGIGLLICHDFAEKIRGRIFYDTKVGFGTTFSLVLPISPRQELEVDNLELVALK